MHFSSHCERLLDFMLFSTFFFFSLFFASLFSSLLLHGWWAVWAWAMESFGLIG
jgi:hypothetical protein